MNNIKNGYVARYFDETLLFVKTLVFKMADLAAVANEGVVAKYGSSAVDTLNPRTWKYYLNISGDYHFSDTPMSVVSMDTLQVIDFTKENLRIHTATAAGYQYGTREYFALVAQYPDQVRLINGILNPADIDQAIDAEDGTILSYRKDLVESNEITLIESLEAGIKRLLFRWYNTQFNISSSLYLASFLTQVYMTLPSRLINLRWDRCHTSEVHSFHVRMFLASHSELDRYIPYLTQAQVLWLYRNIRYIERNAGRMGQFAQLVEHILTARQIPIGSYSSRQTDNFTDYLPQVVAKLTPLNPTVNVFKDNIQAIEEIYARELDMTPGNPEYLKYNQAKSISKLMLSPSTVVQTKALHSAMSDLTNAVPETFETVAIREWCHMTNIGLYESYVTFKDPKSSTVYSLSAEDAFIYFFYVGLRKIGIEVTQIPKYLNMRQRKHPKPAVQDIMKVVPYKEHDLTAVAERLVAGQPALTPCYSVKAFNGLLQQLYQESYYHWFLISSIEDYYLRGVVDNMTNQLFEDELIELNVQSSTIEAWLYEKNLPYYDHTEAEAGALLVAIYQAATGLTDSVYGRLSNIQRALLSLTEELSSYSIQITREINETDMVLVNWPAVRLGNTHQSQVEVRNIEADVLVDDAGGSGVDTRSLTSTQLGVSATHGEDVRTQEVDAVSDWSLGTVVSSPAADPGLVLQIGITYEGQDLALEEQTGIIGYTTVNSLTQAKLNQLKSIY